MQNKYKFWDLLDKLPEGWKIDKTVGSPLAGYEFCTNGKTVFDGQIRALVKSDTPLVKPKMLCTNFTVSYKVEEPNNEVTKYPAREVNELARKKFQEQILKEIQFDLMVCEIEGWDKAEYIKELQNLLNHFFKNNVP